MDTGLTCAIGAKIAGAAKIGDEIGDDIRLGSAHNKGVVRNILSGKGQQGPAFYDVFLKTKNERRFFKRILEYDGIAHVHRKLYNQLISAADQTTPVPLITTLYEFKDDDELNDYIIFLIEHQHEYEELKNY